MAHLQNAPEASDFSGRCSPLRTRPPIIPSCNGCNEVIPTAGAGLQHHVGVLQHLHRYGRRSGPDAPKPLVLEGALPGADRRTDAHCLGGLGRTGSANHGGAAVSQTDATCSNGGLKHVAEQSAQAKEFS